MARASPPHVSAAWSTSEPQSAKSLYVALRDLGCQTADIEEAFFSANPEWTQEIEVSWMAKDIVRHHNAVDETLAQLRNYGVIENSTLLRIDFFYDAPGRREAEGLVEFLRASTDYDVSASRGQRSGLRRGWHVSGTTQPTPVSKEIFEGWIRWMVLAGAQNGECRFDGWGAQVE